MAVEPFRFTDVLTTASAIADLHGSPEVLPAYLSDAVDVLCLRKSMQDLGRARSPFIPRQPGGPEVGPELQRFVGEWFERLGSDVTATVDERMAAEFVAELRQRFGTTDPENI